MVCPFFHWVSGYYIPMAVCVFGNVLNGIGLFIWQTKHTTPSDQAASKAPI